VYTIKDADYNASTNNITVNTTGSDTIENETSGVMTVDGESWRVIGNNTTKNWEVF
jgi:membrane protein implicated in regulation of membrane protease activity